MENIKLLGTNLRVKMADPHPSIDQPPEPLILFNQIQIPAIKFSERISWRIGSEKRIYPQEVYDDILYVQHVAYLIS